jgi:hypothetical protein
VLGQVSQKLVEADWPTPDFLPVSTTKNWWIPRTGDQSKRLFLPLHFFSEGPNFPIFQAMIRFFSQSFDPPSQSVFGPICLLPLSSSHHSSSFW